MKRAATSCLTWEVEVLAAIFGGVGAEHRQGRPPAHVPTCNQPSMLRVTGGPSHAFICEAKGPQCNPVRHEILRPEDVDSSDARVTNGYTDSTGGEGINIPLSAREPR